MKNRIIKVLALILFICIGLGTLFAGDVTFFGPKQYTRDKGKPVTEKDIFTCLPNYTGSGFTLRLINGDSQGNNRVSSAVVEFNGVQVMSPSDFNQDVGLIERTINLNVSNEISVKLNSKPGSYVIIDVFKYIPEPEGTFTANPGTIQYLQSSTLSWNVIYADSISIDNGIGNVEPIGSTQVSPEIPMTTYTLTAINLGGTTTKQVTVNVIFPVPTVTFSASPLIIQPGASSTLTWTTFAAHTVTIDPGIGNVELNGSQTVTPADTTTYTITALGYGGNQTAAAMVTIDGTPPQINVTAPLDGSYLNSPNVSVKGQVVDSSPVTLKVNGNDVPLQQENYFEVPLQMNEGANTISLMAVDAAGNSSTRQVQVVVDTIAPQVQITAPQDNTTFNEIPITITGTVTEANLLKVVLNNQVQAAIDGNTFTFSNVNLSEGENLLTVTAEDKAGNTGSAGITVTYIPDTDPPEIIITSPQDGVFQNNPELTVSGTVTDQSAISYVKVNGTDAVVEGQNYTATLTLAEGENTIIVEAEDQYQNKQSKSVTVMLDTLLPQVMVTQPEPGTYLNTFQVVVKGEVVDASPITVKINNSPVNVQDNQFETTLALAEGANQVKIAVEDAAGNKSSQDLDIFVDTTAPTITVSSPRENTITNKDKITIIGTITDENPIKITLAGNNTEGEIIGNHFYFRDIPLQEGENTFELTAQDRAGNTNQLQYGITIIKDTVIPQLTILSPVTGSLISRRSTLVTGTVSDDHLKEVRINGTIGEIIDNEFNLLVTLVEGDNTINIAASDRAGNVKTETIMITVDTREPLINITSPRANAILNTPAVTVSGRADDSHLASVKINGQTASLTGNEFILENVSLQEGENTITVEAVDTAGSTGVLPISVTLDTAAPSVAGVVPADQTTRVPLSSEVRVEFSEIIDENTLNNQTFFLQKQGQPLNGTITPGDKIVVFKPDGLFPDGSEIVVNVTAGIKDLAGNALQEAYTGRFFTRDTTPPNPPNVEPLPETTGLKKITVAGTAETGTTISVAGGFNRVDSVCDDQGNFSLEVPLKQGQLNQLCVTAKDTTGNESIPACISIYQESTEFAVLDVQFENNEIIVTFSKPIDTTTLTSDNFIVSSASGPESGTISTTGGGTLGIFSPVNDLTSQPIMVEIKTGVTDTEGNGLSYPFAKVFNQEGGEVIAQGEVYDDLTGLPLGGAIVKLVSVDGSAPPEPAPTAVTTTEGKYVIILPSGQTILGITKQGYGYSHRVVLSAAGFSSPVFDSRITPVNTEEKTLLPQGGSLSSGGVVLVYPDGAVDIEKTLRITAVGPQSLQGRLPSGWSPLAAFDLRILGSSQGGSGLLKPCQIRTANQWAGISAASLILAHWDETTYKWKAVSSVSVSPEDITGTIETPGQYAFLIKDTAPAAPPQPVIGEPIAAVQQGSVPTQITAALDFDPALIYPGDTSSAVLTITSGTGISSGVPVQAKVNENYELLVGSTAVFVPYTVDLTAYNYGKPDTKVEFNLSPNSTISLSELKIGTIKADMVRYGAGGLGVIVGPDGGTVSGDGGAEIIIQQGSVNNPIAVTLKKLEEIELTAQVPAGFELIGALDLSLGGAALLKTAIISLSLTQEQMDNIPPDAQLFIVHLEKLDYELFWILKSQGLVENTSIKSFIDVNNNLPFLGITEGGTYLFLRALSPTGFITGTVLEDAQPLARAMVSANNHEIKAISSSSGNYVQTGFTGSVELTAQNRTTNDQGTGTAEIQAAGEIITLNITIQKTGPEIAAITPVNDETGVPLNSKITFVFSEPIKASTFNSQTVDIRKGSEQIQGVYKLSSDGKQGEFIPVEDFPSDSTINIIVTTGLQDLHANGMSQEFTSRFTTVDVIPPEVNLSQLKVLIPENGEATVTGGPGTVEPGTTITVYNERTGETSTGTGDQQGSFEVTINAELSDKLKIIIRDPAENEIILDNKPFVSADGRRMVVDGSGGEFITPEGLGIKIEAGTFAGPVNVGVYEETDPAILATVPEGFEALKAIRVDLSGHTPGKAFKLSIPLPAGVPGDAEVFFAREVNVFGEKKLMVVDTTSIINNRIETNSPPFLGCTAAGVYRVIWNRFLQLGFGTGRVMRPDVVVTAGEFVWVCGGYTLDFIMPVYIGKAVTLTVRDMDTGETLYERTSPGLTMMGQVYDFGGLEDEKDMEPPYLIRSVGIKSLSFDVTSKGFTSQGITVTPNMNNGTVESIDIKGEPGTSVISNSVPGGIHVYKLTNQGIVQISPQDGFQADSGGGFLVNVEAKTGDRIFITVEQDSVPIDQEFVLSFSEPIEDPEEYPEDQKPIKLKEITDDNPEGTKVDLVMERLPSQTDILIRPENQLKDNTRYKFEIAGISDQSNIDKNKLSFDAYFRTFRASRTDILSDLNTVYGSVRYGSYLYVACGDNGINILDVSNPTDIQKVGNYNGTGSIFRAVALYDGPGKKKKLVVVGGGYRLNGYLSILDLTDPKHPLEEKFMFISRTRTSTRKLPEGKPRNIAIIDNYAFVPIFGSGLQVIDLLKLLNGSAHDDCRLGFYLAQGAQEVRAYKRPATEFEPERVIAVLLEDRYGVHIIDFTNAQMPMQIGNYLSGSTTRSGSLELAMDYPVDLNEDGKYEENEKRDLLFFSMIPYPYVFVVDITEVVEKQPVDLNDPDHLIKKIKIDKQSADYVYNMDINVRDKTLAVTDSNNGLILLDMNLALPQFPNQGDYIDDSLDRVMVRTGPRGTISNQGLIWDKDLNMAYLGQSSGRVEAIKLGNPRIKLVYDVHFDTGTHKLLDYKEVIKIAPSGIKDSDNPGNHPDEIYVMAFLPGGISKKLSEDHGKAVCELWSLNSSDAPVIPWDNGKVKTYLKNLELYRLSDNPYYDEYNIFLSKPIRVTIDPDEDRKILYDDQYGMEQESDLRILSGDIIWTHISGVFITGYNLESYISVNDSTGIGDRKFSIRADLIDRKENFDFEGVTGNPDEKPNSPTNNPSIYSGVLLHTGEFVFDDIDLHIPGRGFDFVFNRTYRSQSIYSGVLGWGWDHNYNRRLLELPGGDIIYYDGTGRRERYKAKKKISEEDENQYIIEGYDPPAGRFTELKKVYDGTFRHIFPNRTIEFFDPLGRLIKIQDRNHNKMEFYYNLSGQLTAVMDTMGRIIEFEYYPFEKETDENGIPEAQFKVFSGRLKTITDFSGRIVKFKYHEQTGDLKEVNFMGRIKKYVYVTTPNEDIRLAHNLEKIIDPRGAASESPVLTVTYDNEDKVDKQRFIEMDADIDFTIGNTSTTVDDARGNPKIFNFPSDTRLEVTNGGQTFKYEFNDDHLIKKIEFPGGNSIIYDFYPANGNNRRPAGNLRLARNNPGPLGGKPFETEYQYETAANQVKYIKDPKGNETKIHRDSNGNIDSVELPGIDQPYDYDYYPPGNPRIYGVLKSITDPEGNVTEYEYYPENSPCGDDSQTLQTRDMNTGIGGYLQKVTADKVGVGIYKIYKYDRLGNLKETEDGEGVKTRYEYDNPYGEVSTLVQGATGSNDGQPPANLITTFKYDDNGNVDLETSSTGIIIDYGYDRLDRLTSKTYTGGSDLIMTYGFKYDNNSNLEEVTFPDGVRKDTFTYNSRDLLETETSGSGADTSTIKYEYNDNGDLFSRELLVSELQKIEYRYDGHGRLKKVIGPFSTVTYDYDLNSNLETVDVLGNDGKTLNLEYVYDELNQVTHHKLKKADEVYIDTELGYNKAGYMNKIISPNNHKWDIQPNGVGLPGVITDPLGNADGHSYDKRGLPKGVVEFESGGRTLSHSVRHNVLGDIRRIGDSFRGEHRYKYEYHPQKHVMDTAKDPAGGLVTYGYDGLNRISTVTRHIRYEDSFGEAVTQYKYNANGNLERIIDDGNNVTRCEYDSKDRLTDIYYPGTTNSLHFTYNKNDQVKTSTDLNGTVVTNTYDEAGRLTYREIAPGAGVEGSTYEDFDFDGLGRLVKAENSDSIVTFEYNTAGRLFKETQNLKDSIGSVFATYEVGYQYDDNGNRVKLTYPSNTDPSNTGSPKKEVVYTPDQLDRIDTITSGSNIITDYDYEGKAKVINKKLSNEKVVMTAIYDDGRRPTTLNYKSGANTLFNRTMGWNLVNMKLTETGQDEAREYRYDTAWRLRREDNTKNELPAESMEFVIDDVENLKYIQPAPIISSSTDYQVLRCLHNEKHQVTSVDYKQTVGNNAVNIHVEPSYDNNGNMKSFVHQYTYNYRNQLIEVATGTGVIVKYKYDALGRRIEKRVSDPDSEEITRYVHDGWRVIEERDKDNHVIARYTYGNGIDERVELEYDIEGDNTDALVTYIPMQDTIGNVIGIADETGKLLERYSYSTYGTPVFEYDSTPPVINNVYVIDGMVITAFSEPVNSETVTNALKVRHEGNEVPGTIELGADGKEIKFIPSPPLPAGQVTVDIAETVEDEVGNKMESSFSNNFMYSEITTIVHDNSAPEVDRIEKRSNDFIVTFSERIDSNTTANSIEIKKADGSVSGSVTIVNERTFKFTPEEILEANREYELWVKSTLKDLDGKSINEFFHRFVVMNDDMLIYEKSDPNRHSSSNIGNNYLFHGRTYEPEIGLYYYRNRYYLPRVGRFLQIDPYQYEDSMNLYQAFNMNPVNFTDPMGQNIVVVVTPSGSVMKEHLSLEEFWYLLRREYSPTDAEKILKQTEGYGKISDMRIFALEVCGRGSPIINTTLGQFAKDMGAGTINAGVELMSIGFKIMSMGTPKACEKIDKIKGSIQGKVNKVLGANDGSLGYFFGTIYGPTAVGGVSAGLSSPTTQTTSKTLPFLSKSNIIRGQANRIKALPKGGETTLTREQVARFRGTGRERGLAFNEYLNQAHGGTAEVHVNTQLGKRFHDVGDIPMNSITEMAVEGKNFLRFRRINGEVIKGQVPLNNSIQTQIYKDVLWIWEGKKLGIHRIVQWEFAGAGPSSALAEALQYWRLPYVF